MSKETEQLDELKTTFSAELEIAKKRSSPDEKKRAEQAQEYMRRRKMGVKEVQKEANEYLASRIKQLLENAPPVSIAGGAAPTTQSPEVNYAAKIKKKLLRRTKRG